MSKPSKKLLLSLANTISGIQRIKKDPLKKSLASVEIKSRKIIESETVVNVFYTLKGKKSKIRVAIMFD